MAAQEPLDFDPSTLSKEEALDMINNLEAELMDLRRQPAIIRNTLKVLV